MIFYSFFNPFPNGPCGRIDSSGQNDVKLVNYSTFANYSEQPTWSPDGEWIVFVSSLDGHDVYYDIYLLDKDGDNLRKLENCEAGCSSPSFTPDGLSIIYTEGYSIQRLHLNGEWETILPADHWTRYADPACSPAINQP